MQMINSGKLGGKKGYQGTSSKTIEGCVHGLSQNNFLVRLWAATQ